ncbi:MAG TPA: DUF4136 domain-containing protein [Polyangiaceae bacterium]|nr:DUF4136 domain-containing protein [Polyangiaceae bacterium]
MKIVGNCLSSLVSVAALSVALCMSCASTPTSDIRVHSAADPKSNLAAYKSYAWDTNAGVLQDRTGAWVPKDIDTQSEVQFLIDKKLRERGLTVAQSSPDLLVSMLIVADVKEVQEIKSKRGDAVTGLDPVGAGALLVELVDSQTGKTVWLGAAEGEVRGSNSLEVSKQRLAYAVDKLFDKLPH